MRQQRKEVRPVGSYYASIAKSLERIADALEKMTAPGADGRELCEKAKREIWEEISQNLQAQTRSGQPFQ